MGKIHIYSTLDRNRKTIEGNGRLCDLLPDFNFTNAVILKGGYRVTEKYEVEKNDVIFIRPTPTGVTAAIVVGVTAAVVATGAAIGSAIYAKKKTQEAQRKLDEVQQKAKALAEAVQQQPFVQGAKNKNALGQVIPIVMGEVFHTPYFILSRRYHISGTDGADQYVDGVMCLGYNNQIVKSFSIGKTKVKTWSDTTPQNGVYKQDAGVYYDANNIIEIRQTGNFETESFNQKVTVADSGAEIKHDYGGKVEPLIIQAGENAESVEVAISFQGLRKYTDSGYWTNASVKVVPYWSNNADSVSPTWIPFTFSGSSDNTFSRNTNKEIRFAAKKTFTAAESYGKKITIKLERQTPKAESNANDTVTCLYVQTLHYDAKKSTAQKLVKCDAMENPLRDMTTRIGVRLKATQSTQNLLDEFNFIVQGTARTWNGASWSTGKNATRNPAAWLLELLTSPHHRHSRYSDEELDLESFGQLYEYCEAENFHTDGIVTATKKKSDLLSSILSGCFSDIIIGVEGKIEAVTDKKEDTPIALLNSQSIISATVSKAFSRKTAGRKVTFTNRKVWQIDNAYIMKNGGSKTQDDVVTELSPEYVTEYAHAYKIAKRDMAREELQPREVTVEVGREGEYYPLYSVVNVQLQQLRVGLQSSIIHSTKQSGGYLSEIIISDYVDLIDGYTYGVTIQAQDDTGRKTITAEVIGTGRTRTLTVLTPVKVEGVMPVYGNVLSFGIVDKVTIPMKITGVKPAKSGFSLTLRDYSPAMYEYGDIPEYKTNLTTPPQAGEKVPALTEAQISDIATGAAGGVVQKGEAPDTPAIVVTAERDGIRLQVLPLSATAKNVIQSAKWEIKKSENWEEIGDSELSTLYRFDRATDGYPEASDLVSWRVRCKVINLWNMASEYGGGEAGQVINTDNYGTWELSTPAVVVSVSNRSINLNLSQQTRGDNREQYGTIRYRIAIKRPDIDSEFFKPSTGLNPYAGEQNYKDGTGYVTATGNYTQTLPLQGQNNDPPAPMATLYQYQITAENEAGTGTPAVVNATALATSVHDIVKGWYINEQGEKEKIDGALGAENIYTESLAAISANMGDITAGSISSVPEAGETKPNVLLDLDNEEFRIGNTPSLEDSGSEDAEYIHYTKGQGLVMKIKNFVVTALASIISGIFRVKAKGTADSGSFFVVNPESTTDSTTGTPAKSTKFLGQIVGYKNIPIAPQYYELNLTSLSKDKWYPVFFNPTDMELALELHSPNVLASSDYNQNTISIRWIEHGWSDTPKRLTVYNYGLYQNTEVTIMMLVAGNHSGGKAIYLRGGLLYRMRSNEVPQLKTSDYTCSDEVYPVVSDYTTGANTRIVWRADEMIASGAYNQLQNLKVVDSLTVTGSATVGTATVKGDSNGNTVVGQDALSANTTGNYNTAVGDKSLKKNTTGNFNTAIGSESLVDNTTGNNNVAIGWFSGGFYPEWNNQINLNGRLYYLEFSESATQDKVYKTLWLYVPAGSFISALGEFSQKTVSRLNGLTNSIEFVASDNTKIYTVTNGSTATLGKPLRLWFMNIINPVSDNNK